MFRQNFLLKAIKTGVILILFTPLILGPFGLSLSNYPKTVFFRTLVEIIFIFYLLLILFVPRYLPGISVSLVVVSIYIGILLLTGITGFNFGRSFFGDLHRVEGIILHIHLLVFFLVLLSVFRQKEDWILFFKLSVIVSAFSSFAGVLQKLQLAKFYGVSLPERISGTWANPDFFASYILLVIFLGIFLLLIEKDKNWKILLISILALNCLTLILSGTRAAWIGLAFGVSFLFFVWFFSALTIELKIRKLIIFGVFFFCAFLFLFVLFQDALSLDKNLFFQRALSVFNVDTLFHSARFPIWQIAVDGWKEKPIFGWGPESFTYVFDKYFKTEHLEFIGENFHYDKPHNKILEITAASGIIGLLSYLAIFFVIFYMLWKSRKTKPIIALVFSAFFISYFIANLFSFDTLGTYLIFFLALGFLENSVFKHIGNSVSKKETEFPVNKNKKFLKLILISPFILLSLITFFQLNFKPTSASLAFVRAVNETDFRKNLLGYQEGISKNTFYDNDFEREAARQLIFVLENHQPPREIEKKIVETLVGLQSSLEKKLEAPERHFLETYELLARINERIYLLEQDQEALEKMEEIINYALAFNEHKPELYRLLGKKEIFQGNFSRGEEYFQKSLEKTGQSFGDRVYFHKSLGAAYLRAGVKEPAAENLKKALDIDLTLKKFREAPSTKAHAETQKKGIQQTIVFAQNLAWLYYQELNDLETGREVYEKTIEIFPEYERQLRFNWEMMIE